MGMFRKEEIMSEEEKKFLEIVDLKRDLKRRDTAGGTARDELSVAKGEFCAARTVRLREIDAAQYYRRH